MLPRRKRHLPLEELRGKQQAITLESTEFIRRFLMHFLPAGFHRIRHFGILRAETLKQCRELNPPEPQPAALPVEACELKASFSLLATNHLAIPKRPASASSTVRTLHRNRHDRSKLNCGRRQPSSRLNWKTLSAFALTRGAAFIPIVRGIVQRIVFEVPATCPHLRHFKYKPLNYMACFFHFICVHGSTHYSFE